LTDVAQGDFTRDIQVKGSDEIARMGKGMQQFVVNMREIITELTNTADWLKAHSKENEEASENLMTSADEEQREMDTLKRQADVLAETANRVSEEMTKLTEEIQATMARANEHMEASVSGVKNSAQMVETASETFRNVFGKVEETDTIVHRMVDMVDEVN